MTFTTEDVLAVEHAAVHAWPASETRDIDGWLWRYSGGNSQRANSVSPLTFHGDDVEAAIGAAEDLYFARGSVSRFQVGSGFANPTDLDDRLIRRGYYIHDPVTTLVKRLDHPPMPDDIVIADRPDEGWMEVYLSNITPDRRPPAPRILAAVPAPCAFLSVRRGGRTFSTALAVLHDGVVVAECVGTRSDERRSGAGRAVMLALESWGAEQGARISGLQAVTANVAAQGLYRGLGYSAANSYHYRVLNR